MSFVPPDQSGSGTPESWSAPDTGASGTPGADPNAAPFGAPASPYGTPPTDPYGAPAPPSTPGAPAGGFGAPPPDYGAAPGGYGAPPPDAGGGYGAPPPAPPYGANPYGANPYGAPPSYGAPPYGAAPYGAAPQYGGGTVPSGTNGLAIASLVTAILWIFWLGSLLGVIFGFVSLSQIKKTGGVQQGRGLAIAGIVIGFIGFAALVLSIALIAAHVHCTTVNGTSHCTTTGNS